MAQTLRLREGEGRFKTDFRQQLRKESPGLILPECCDTMRLTVTKNRNGSAYHVAAK